MCSAGIDSPARTCMREASMKKISCFAQSVAKIFTKRKERNNMKEEIRVIGPMVFSPDMGESELYRGKRNV